MKILDLSAGKREIWFDGCYRDAVFVDIRPEVDPDFVADSRDLPSEVGSGYQLVVFDPTHMDFRDNAEFAKEFGSYAREEIREIVHRTAREAHRVTVGDALMAFKWNDQEQPLRPILALLLPWWEPLFGTPSIVREGVSVTYWVMLRRASR